MKKLTVKRYLWLRKRIQNESSSKQRIASIKKNRLLFETTRIAVDRIRQRIKMPEFMAAEDPAKRAEIWKCMSKGLVDLEAGNTVSFDFTKTKIVFPGGMLIFIAWVELLIEAFPNRVSVIAHPSSLVAQLFEHVGYAKKLRVLCPAVKHPSVLNWEFLTGAFADGESISKLLRSYKETSDTDAPEGLYDVLTEALTNVRHHAYTTEVEIPESMQRWWLFSRYDPPSQGKAGKQFIAIYDIGVGIQNSLKQKLTAGEVVRGIASDVLETLKLSTNDLERVLLKKAVEQDRSVTGEDNRGKGLPEMLEFLKKTEEGRLYIVSGHAQYACFAKDAEGVAYFCNTVVPGTLLLWSIQIGAPL